MDFKLEQIDLLFAREPDIQNVEDALDKLELTLLGYNHNFVGRLFVDPESEYCHDNNNICQICFNPKEAHKPYVKKMIETGKLKSYMAAVDHVKRLTN